MSFPIPNYSRVWVRGRFVDLSKASQLLTSYGLTGPVKFTPSPRVLLDTGTKQIISTGEFSVTPSATDGYFAILLPATDDPDINPSAWTYAVVEPTGRSYNIVVPIATPVLSSPGDPLDGQRVIELVTVVPAPAPNAGSVQLVVGAAGRGVASMTTDGSNHVIVTYTDGSTSDLGAITGGVAKGELVINVRDYGAVGDGIADDTAAIQSALTAGLTTGARVFARGTFKITSTVLIKGACDLADATFNFTGAGVAVQVGDPTSLVFRQTFRLPSIIATAKTALGWSQVAGTTGVRVSNLYSCDVHLPRVRSFELGLCGHGQASNGTSYCRFFVGQLDNNKVNFQALPDQSGSTSGWFTSNSFYGGRFSHNSSEGPLATGVRHVVISAGYWSVDNLTFWGTSLESPSVVDYHIECYGSTNVFDNCRFENPGTARILWRSSARDNRINGGVGADRLTQVTESGAYNYGTAAALANFTTASRPPSLGVGGLAADSTLARPIYSADGIITKVVALQDDIVGQITGVGAPEGVAAATPGTIYTRTDSGARTNACRYPISSSVAATTGWVSGLGGAMSAGSGYLRSTLSVTTGSRTIASNQNTFAVTPSTVYAFRAQARSSETLATQMTVRFYTSALVATGALVAGATTVLDPTTFADVPSITTTSPSDAAFALIVPAAQFTGTSAVGDTIDVRRVMYEAAAGVGAYIDGALPSAGGVVYAWTGTANASTSTATYTTRPISYVKTGSGTTGWKALAPAGGISVLSAATDSATTQALVNDLRAALITSGLVS